MALVDLKEAMSKVDDTREVLDITCRGLEDVSKRTIELKRKADDAHDRTRSHTERGGARQKTVSWPRRF